MAQLRVPVYFDIRRYLTDKYFDIVWGCQPPSETPKWNPKNLFFERLNLGCQSVLISADFLTDKYFDIVWGAPLRDPPK